MRRTYKVFLRSKRGVANFDAGFQRCYLLTSIINENQTVYSSEHREYSGDAAYVASSQHFDLKNYTGCRTENEYLED